MEEAYHRLDDARVLRERDRHARAISSSYYAVLAAGKGALKAEGMEVSSHKALRVHLGKVFIRHGDLPDDTAAFIEELYKDRLQADYELVSFPEETASNVIAEVSGRMRRFEALL
ncbi:MAG: HEPN domain-containing protein [Salinivenus sp.]